MRALAGLWRRWRGAPAAEAARWIVLDVETSGLDAERARLLAIAAVGVHFDATGRPRIRPGDSFELLLGHEAAAAEPDKDNILVHGIGVGAQQRGIAPAEALRAFEAWADGAPCVAFHADFDRRLLERAGREHLGRPLGGPWLDLRPLAAMAWPQVAARALDDWLAHFGLHCAARHNAAADTLVTAELLLRVWPAVAPQIDAARGGRWRAAQQLAAQARWLPPP